MRSKTLACTLLASVLTVAASSAQQPDNRQRNANYGKLPLTFEATQGQTGLPVNFLARGEGYTAFLTSGGMVLSLRANPVATDSKSANVRIATAPAQSGSTALQFTLVGASKNPAVVGEDLLPGKVNYFLGNDPAKWRTNVPTYGRVRYKNVYPGIDLVYYGNQRQLEYDFEVQAGADPRRIQFEIQGASQIGLDPDGNLILRVRSGDLHFQSPMVYQESSGRRKAVDGAYVLEDATHVGFKVAHYDSGKPLVIDPVLIYSSYLGGSGNDQPAGIAIDGTGNVYVAGYTDSADFPLATLGGLPKNTNHVFVAKLDPSGSNLIYADYIGGSSQDYGVALVLDSANDVYVTGSTQSSNFPVVKPYQAQAPGPYTGFLTKVSADGSSLLYSTYLGGNTFDQPTGIAIDGFGQVHVAGYTLSQNFPVVNAYQATASANQGGLYGTYGFLTKFAVDGSSLIYSTYLAGNSNVVLDCGSPCWPAPYNVLSAIAIDANGNAYVTGTTNTYNFPATAGTFLTTNTTQQDATVGFVSKFSSAGNLDYSTYFYGSSGNPIGMNAIAVDSSGSAYVAGAADSDGSFPLTSTSICDPGVYAFGCSYAFVTKFDPAASTLLYSTFLGPNNYAVPQAIALDAAGNAFVLASTSSDLFQTNNAIEEYAGKSDLLLVEIDAAASTQLFSTYLGGAGNDSPSGLALDAAGNIYVSGSTNSPDLPVTQGVFQTLPGGNIDAFVMKIGAASAPSVTLSPSALQFSSQQVGSTSQAQVVLLRNLGSAALTITSIAVAGDFSENDNCATSVPAASSCNLSVSFTPTAVGLRTGSIRVNDNAAGSPHLITLSGSGLGATVSLTPSALLFSSVPVGTASTSQTVTLANQGNTSLSLGNIQTSGDYAQTNNCPGSLAASSSCTINVTFTPAATGSRTGSLTISDSAAGSPQTVALSGAGSDFSVSSSPGSVTIKAGSPATYTLTVASVGGAFTNAVNLTCSGAPAKSTCNLSAPSVTPGANSATVTVTVQTTASSANAAALFVPRPQPVYAVWMQLQGFGLFGLLLLGARRKPAKSGRSTAAMLILLVLLVAGLLFMSACAGGTGIGQQGQSGTTPGTYTITLTGTSGSLTHAIPLTLTVQ